MQATRLVWTRAVATFPGSSWPGRNVSSGFCQTQAGLARSVEMRPSVVMRCTHQSAHAQVVLTGRAAARHSRRKSWFDRAREPGRETSHGRVAFIRCKSAGAHALRRFCVSQPAYQPASQAAGHSASHLSSQSAGHSASHSSCQPTSQLAGLAAPRSRACVRHGTVATGVSGQRGGTCFAHWHVCLGHTGRPPSPLPLAAELASCYTAVSDRHRCTGCTSQ